MPIIPLAVQFIVNDNDVPDNENKELFGMCVLHINFESINQQHRKINQTFYGIVFNF